MSPHELPLIDVRPLAAHGEADRRVVARQLDQACRRGGIVRITGHGVPGGLRADVTTAAAAFFALAESEQAEITMVAGGADGRGWVPRGGGRPDRPEAVDFGDEPPPDDPRAGLAGPGPDVLPADPPSLRPVVLAWMAAMTSLGRRLLDAIGLALDLPRGWFDEHVVGRPTTMLRIVRYPTGWADGGDGRWVREHTDDGLLTMRAQDGTAAVEVRGPDGWITVPPDPEILLVNVGDLLARMTGGLYRAARHRGRDGGGVDRLSLQFSLHPDRTATVTRLPIPELDVTDVSAGPPRRDHATAPARPGPYGEYLTAKMARAFPDMASATRRR